MIKVCFFANLRERLQCAEISIDQFSGSQVKDLLHQLLSERPQWSEYLTHKNVLIAVNHSMATITTPIKTGDEVAFFPPVTGG